VRPKEWRGTQPDTASKGDDRNRPPIQLIVGDEDVNPECARCRSTVFRLTPIVWAIASTVYCVEWYICLAALTVSGVMFAGRPRPSPSLEPFPAPPWSTPRSGLAPTRLRRP
jgi:hypothetical protein